MVKRKLNKKSFEKILNQKSKKSATITAKLSYHLTHVNLRKSLQGRMGTLLRTYNKKEFNRLFKSYAKKHRR